MNSARTINSNLIVTGLAVNDPNFLFDPNYPFTCCRICGAVYQRNVDRAAQVTTDALLGRRRWSFEHAAKHTKQEHDALATSGAWCTPEAAIRLTPFGIVSVIDLVMSDEIESAYKDAHVIPVEDCEGRSA